jgi:phosphoribosylaminoimidazole synthetase
MYAPGDYDLAGFAVGLVERDRVLPFLDAQVAGDVLLALPSSGVHSNGFSLVRRVIDHAGADWQAPPPFPSAARRLCDAVLAPTKIYIKALLPVIKEQPACRIKGMAHITGGGLPDNLPRALAPGLRAVIDCAAWDVPPVFKWMAAAGPGVAPEEMARTFNLGVGMVVIVGAADADAVTAAISAAGEPVLRIGTLQAAAAAAEPVVELRNLAAALARK